MQLIFHFASAIIAFLFLLPIIGIENALVVAAASFFIDLDHVIWYWLKKGVTLDLKKINRFFLASEKGYFIMLFHTPELWIVIIAASWIFGYPWIAVGFGLHMAVDLTADIGRFERQSIIIPMIKKK